MPIYSNGYSHFHISFGVAPIETLYTLLILVSGLLVLVYSFFSLCWDNILYLLVGLMVAKFMLVNREIWEIQSF